MKLYLTINFILLTCSPKTTGITLLRKFEHTKIPEELMNLLSAFLRQTGEFPPQQVIETILLTLLGLSISFS